MGRDLDTSRRECRLKVSVGDGPLSGSKNVRSVSFIEVETEPEPVQLQDTGHADDVVVAQPDGWRALWTRTTRPPHIVEEDVGTSEGMVADVTPSSHAADVEKEVAAKSSVPLSAAKKKKQRRHRTEAVSSVWSSTCCLPTANWLQAQTQVIGRIDIPDGVKVTQFVCEVENSSVLLRVEDETSRKCSSSASILVVGRFSRKCGAIT